MRRWRNEKKRENAGKREERLKRAEECRSMTTRQDCQKTTNFLLILLFSAVSLVVASSEVDVGEPGSFLAREGAMRARCREGREG